MYNSNQISKIYKKIISKSLQKKYSKMFDDEFYSSIDNNVGKLNYKELLKYSNTMGQCNFFALLLCKVMNQSCLCKGYLNKLNCIRDGYIFEKFEHSWVEFNDFVFDTTSKQVFKKNAFYQIFNVEKKEIYTHDDLNDDTLFVLLGLKSLKNRECLLCDNFVLAFYDVFDKNKNNDAFIENVKSYLSKEKILKKLLEISYNKFKNNQNIYQ